MIPTHFLSLLPLLLTLTPTVSALTLQKRTISGPVITSNFADPCIIQVNNTWYAFSTTSGGKNIPMATSTDFKKWDVLEGADALPKVGAWSSGKNVWAPDVIAVDGGYALFYTAEDKDHGGHCVSVATSKNIKGPYEPIDTALACPYANGGAIDPSGFRDSDGSLYLLWKVDGNSKGHGGNCNNGKPPIVPTPIMIQQLNPDGTSFKSGSSAKQILDRSDLDGPLIEAPSLVRSSEGTYFLFYSSNCYSSSFYDIAYATSKNVLGPYTKGPWLMKTGTPFKQLYAPGGADVTPDGTKLVFHADKEKSADVRQMYTADIKLEGDKVSV